MDVSGLLKINDPYVTWKEHPSLLGLEVTTLFCSALCLLHALLQGRRYVWLYLAAVLHGLTVENLSFSLDEINNFWHAPATVMFRGSRLPLHIISLYPLFTYPAFLAMERLKLPTLAKPFAVGLLVNVIDYPYDIMGGKHLWWTWHDTDPNIAARNFWVPWNSYYFHASFAFALTTIFLTTQHILVKGNKQSFSGNLLSAVLTGALSMPLGVVQFVVFYHPLHDMLGADTELCVMTLLALYLLVLWTQDRHQGHRTKKGFRFFSDLPFVSVVVFLLYHLGVVWTARPEDIVSNGLHETVGPCDQKLHFYNALGQKLSKRKFLCASDYSEPFDWHCVPGRKPPAAGTSWYTICGTPYETPADYLLVVTAACLFGIWVFYQVLLRSGEVPLVPTKVSPVKNSKSKSNKQS